MRKHIGLITSGGNSPGMNSAIRAVVRTALLHDVLVTGYLHGWEGVIRGETVPMDSRSVGGILNQGGTILRTARSAEFRSPAGRQTAVEQLRKDGVEGMVVIGGDGSLTGAIMLEQDTGFPCVGVPGSIDNDIPGTDRSIGFDTAVNTAVEAIDKLRDTAYSHERIFVVEVMGRRNGYIAIEAGLGGGAEAVLIPEIPYDLVEVCEELKKGHARGKKSNIIVVAEGVARADEIGNFVARYTGYDTRCLVLGHMQRGGSPTAFDRVLALRLGAFAAERLIAGHSNEMAGVSSGQLVPVPLDIVVSESRVIDESRLALVQAMAR